MNLLLSSTVECSRTHLDTTTPFFVVSSRKLHLCAILSPFSSIVDASCISRQSYLETSTLETVREQKSFTPTQYVPT